MDKPIFRNKLLLSVIQLYIDAANYGLSDLAIYQTLDNRLDVWERKLTDQLEWQGYNWEKVETAYILKPG